MYSFTFTNTINIAKVIHNTAKTEVRYRLKSSLCCLCITNSVRYPFTANIEYREQFSSVPRSSQWLSFTVAFKQTQNMVLTRFMRLDLPSVGTPINTWQSKNRAMLQYTFLWRLLVIKNAKYVLSMLYVTIHTKIAPFLSIDWKPCHFATHFFCEDC